MELREQTFPWKRQITMFWLHQQGIHVLVFLFFFWMQDVSHLLFEACSKIIAQLQTAVAEKKGESRVVGRKGRSKRRWDLGTRNAAGLRVHVRQMGDETGGKARHSSASLFAL